MSIIDSFNGRSTSGGIWGDASSGPTWSDELGDGDYAYVDGGVGILLSQPFVDLAESAPGGHQRLTFAVPYADEASFEMRFAPLSIEDGEVTMFVRLGPIRVRVDMRPDSMADSGTGAGVSGLQISREDVDTDLAEDLAAVPTWETDGWWILKVDHQPGVSAQATLWHDGDTQPSPQVSIDLETVEDIDLIDVQITRALGYVAPVSAFGVTDFDGDLGLGLEYGDPFVGWFDDSISLVQSKAFGYGSAADLRSYADTLEQTIRLVSPSGGADSVAWIMELIDIPPGADGDPFGVAAADWWNATAIGTIATGGGVGVDYSDPGLGFGPYDIDVAGPTSFAWRVTTTAATPAVENYLTLFSGDMLYHGDPAADPDATQGVTIDWINDQLAVLDCGCTPFTGDGVPTRNQPIEDELVGTGDGSTTSFTTAWPYLPYSLEPEVDGVMSGFDPSGPAAGDLEVLPAPGLGARVTVSYRASG